MVAGKEGLMEKSKRYIIKLTGCMFRQTIHWPRHFKMFLALTKDISKDGMATRQAGMQIPSRHQSSGHTAKPQIIWRHRHHCNGFIQRDREDLLQEQRSKEIRSPWRLMHRERDSWPWHRRTVKQHLLARHWPWWNRTTAPWSESISQSYTDSTAIPPLPVRPSFWYHHWPQGTSNWTSSSKSSSMLHQPGFKNLTLKVQGYSFKVGYHPGKQMSRATASKWASTQADRCPGLQLQSGLAPRQTEVQGYRFKVGYHPGRQKSRATDSKWATTQADRWHS